MVSYVRAEINVKYADILLLACCFCSGLLDSTMYNGESHSLHSTLSSTPFLSFSYPITISIKSPSFIMEAYLHFPHSLQHFRFHANGKHHFRGFGCLEAG